MRMCGILLSEKIHYCSLHDLNKRDLMYSKQATIYQCRTVSNSTCRQTPHLDGIQMYDICKRLRNTVIFLFSTYQVINCVGIKKYS